MATLKEKYAEKLAKRSRESRVYRQFQLVGLEIAEILSDRKHKALYIKLAKGGDGERLLRTAKEIAEKKNVKNKGAYFMSIIKNA